MKREALVRVLIALAWLPLLACGDRSGSAATASEGPLLPVVDVLELDPRPLADTVEVLGQLEPEETVLVRSEIAGVIADIHFAEGDEVEKDQILFTLRDHEQRARLREAQADLSLAEDAHRRAGKLAEHETLSPAQLERARAQLETARARAELADVELARTRIRAPFDGVAGARRASPGASIDRETDLVEIQAIDWLELSFSLPEQALPLARAGLPFEFSVAPYPGETFPGRIAFIAPGLNPSNRRLLVQGRVHNPQRRLRPGLFARIDAQIAEREHALVVPEEAVVAGPRGPFVWRVIDDDAVESVDVELGIRKPGIIEIRSGLSPGDVIVVAGTHKLTPGARVVPKPAASATQAKDDTQADARG